MSKLFAKIFTVLLCVMMMTSFFSCTQDDNEIDDPNPIVHPDKMVNFSLWDWQVSTSGDAKRLAQEIKAMGFTGVDFTFRWSSLEYEKDNYYFSYIDSMLDEFKKEDLLISTSLMFWSINIPWMDDIEWQKTSGGQIYEFTGRGASPSFSHQPTVDKMVNSFKAFSSHVIDRYGDRVTRIHARTSQYGELEYFCGSDFMLDYGAPAISAFKEYLQLQHGTVNSLLQSTAVTESFTAWEDLNAFTPHRLSELFYYDWQMFRQREALSLSKLFQNALKEIDENIPFALQVGCVWDASASNMRGVFDPYLASKACDILHTDDGPGFPHDFSMDLINVTDEVEYASEIDGFWHPTIQTLVKSGDTSLSPYVRQARMMGEAGIKYLNTANWSYTEIKTYQTQLSNYPTAFTGATVRSPREENIAILINTADFIYKQRNMADMLLSTYNSLSAGNTKKVRFVTDTQLIENPQLLNEIQTLYLGSTYGEYCIRKELVSLLLSSQTKLSAMDNSSNILFKDEYRIFLSAQLSNGLKAKFN